MDERIFDDFLGQTMLGVVSLGLGLIILALDRRSRTNLALGIFWILAGALVATIPHLAGQADPENTRLVERLHAVLIGSIPICVGVYIAGLLTTAQVTLRARRVVIGAAILGSVLAGCFAALGVALPATYLNDYSLAVDGTEALTRSGFWLFASIWTLMGLAFTVCWLVLSTQRVDVGERSRAICYALASPLLVVSTMLPPRVALVVYTLTFCLVLYGTFRYMFVQGERAAFLSRFLSPQVAELVRLQGLTAVMQPQELDVSVVCIDFRGFTAYTEAIPTQAVIDLISEYHEAIAEAVATHDGMVKDYAGDGILILVGAPIARPDHATAALAIARGSMVAAQRVTNRWATGIHPLGVGIGVASGRVTVGAIGETARMDYTAVGTPVNLAARLCGAAADGEILLDSHTAAAADDGECQPRAEVALKGISVPTEVFAYPLAAASPTAQGVTQLNAKRGR